MTAHCQHLEGGQLSKCIQLRETWNATFGFQNQDGGWEGTHLMFEQHFSDFLRGVRLITGEHLGDLKSSDTAKQLEQQGYLLPGFEDFEWGHDQHFGPLVIQDTYMGHRHINNWATYAELFHLPMRLDGLDVLDVGVMAGASSYLFAAMGAKSVTALEEAPKSCAMIEYIAEHFSLPIKAACLSLYDLAEEQVAESSQKQGSGHGQSHRANPWVNKFDLVVFSGVLYHISDPLLALRILFNTLKPGGLIAVETAAPGKAKYDEVSKRWKVMDPNSGVPLEHQQQPEDSRLREDFGQVPPDRLIDYHNGGLNSARSNNFYLASPGVLKDWLKFVGFGRTPGASMAKEADGWAGVNVTDPGVPWGKSVRVFGVGRKPPDGYVDFMRGGFARPHIC